MIYRYVAVILLVFLFGGANRAEAQPKAPSRLSVLGIYMEPNGPDAAQYASGAGGIGMILNVPAGGNWHWLAGVVGFDWINLRSKTAESWDHDTGLRVEQRTAQDYTRFFLGGEIGGHTRGFLRPHIGMNLALIMYGYSIDIVVPDDYDVEREIRQNVDSETHFVFGQDISLGLDFRLSRFIDLDLGTRYLKSYGVPQDLGRDMETVYPEYIQVYLGLGFSSNFLSKFQE